MFDAIAQTFEIMSWLGIIFFILVITNIVSGTLANVWSGSESFSKKKMSQGILKAVVFYISSLFIGLAFTMLPFINDMITGASGDVLLSKEMLETLSSVGVLGVVVSAIIVQGKKAFKNIIKLANLSSGDEEKITWTVEEETEDVEEK